MTSQECAKIILNWIESFSDDDCSNDAVRTIKPYAVLAQSQLANEHCSTLFCDTKPNSCNRVLQFFVAWYDSFCDNTYIPKHKGKVFCQIPDKKYHAKHEDPLKQLKHSHYENRIETIPARHDEISVDAMQQFLRPWAYMFASALHIKVKFDGMFFNAVKKWT